MFNIGWPELILILFVCLLLFGAGRLPEIAKQLGIVDQITSPTFSYLNSYAIPGISGNQLHHFDLYRLVALEEFLHQGFDEILQNKNDLIFDESFLKSLNKIINCETSSRVLLLNSLNSEFTFLGDWIDFKNLKVSQTYSIQDYSKITYYPTSHSNFNFKNYAYDDDYYSDDYNTYYDSEKNLRKELLKKSLYKMENQN